jgi:ubiquinone/menaquinone biosynthesis C-methylase UbiE
MPYSTSQQTKPSFMINSYVVQNVDERERQRATIQDALLTLSMGGVLPEQDDPTSFSTVLDVGCATGGWLLEAAKTYPGMTRLVGIDDNPQMIEDACTRAEAAQVADRVSFMVADAQKPLPFPDETFDLVNLRFTSTFVHTYDWQRLIRDWLRVTRIGGVVRITESEVIPQSNSPALSQLYTMLMNSLFVNNHLFTQESGGLINSLEKVFTDPLLRVNDAHTHAFTLEYWGGTPEAAAFAEEVRLAFQVLRPFIEQFGSGENYELIYQQALKEIQQPDFHVTSQFLTVWGHKPTPGRADIGLVSYERYTPRGSQQGGLYFADYDNKVQMTKEIERLATQGEMLTEMAGLLSEQPDPTRFQSVLDVACGTGSWLIELAKAFPHMDRLVGIDAGKSIIQYANSCIPDELRNCVQFAVMDALDTNGLSFGANTFDLVNVRFSLSWMRTFDWERLVRELLRVVCLEGVVRITEPEMMIRSNSDALTQLLEAAAKGFYRNHNLFTEKPSSLIDRLSQLLQVPGLTRRVDTVLQPIEFHAGSPIIEQFYQDIRNGAQVLPPFLQKYRCLPKNYDALLQQALHDIQQPDFHATWNLLTAWTVKTNINRVHTRDERVFVRGHAPRRDTAGIESSSTYFIDVREEAELQRLSLQDTTMTQLMGGVMPEQKNPNRFANVLDVACGTGGWLLEAAQTYPGMNRLVGVDLGKNMIEFARAQLRLPEMDRWNAFVSYYVMDVLKGLDFPDNSFDLVNARLVTSFLRTSDWEPFLKELLRVTRPGGTIRITEPDVFIPSISPAISKFNNISIAALYKAGHLFTNEGPGLIKYLPRLLTQAGCKDVQTHHYALDYAAGSPHIQAFAADAAALFQLLRPFFEKLGLIDESYDALRQQALEEMRQPDFHATWNLLTAWGTKPRAGVDDAPPSSAEQQAQPQKRYSRSGESTYIMAPRDDDREQVRLHIQDKLVTASLGGALPEQPDTDSITSVLDVACGTGYWLLETAQTYPHMTRLVGIDIDARTIEYARKQVPAELANRVEFDVMDAHKLKFDNDSFDLVNARFVGSFLFNPDWISFVDELLRVTRPGGLIRITDTELIPESDSSAVTQLFEMLMLAMYKAEKISMLDSAAITNSLAGFLSQGGQGAQQIQTRAQTLHYAAGTPEGEAFYQDVSHIFQTARPFIEQMGCASEDYDELYQQALADMRQPTFLASLNMLTAWGRKRTSENQFADTYGLTYVEGHRKGGETASTYFIHSREDDKEHRRLDLQDRLFTSMMGGTLPEQPDPNIFHNVLDVACGTGGWLIEAAQTYPGMANLVGVDISKKMLEFARKQVPDTLKDFITFHEMDVHQGLQLPDDTFDLVNVRFAIGWMNTSEWQPLLRELLRVTYPGGIIRLTEGENGWSNSPALTQILQMLQTAMYRAKRVFATGNASITTHLPQQLLLSGCVDVQTQAYALQYEAGTPATEGFYNDVKMGTPLIRPFLEKSGCLDKDYDAICQQALADMQRPDFHGVGLLVTAWGTKPRGMVIE